MTSNQIEPAGAIVPRPARVGQATVVEQARAMAEVHAAMLIAREMPRDISTAMREMEQSCGQLALADRAFYKYPRGGQNVTGASVYLARELARCWGNIQHGVNELRRDDDDGHQSEMQAWAWDVQLNTRSSSTFIVPHKRDRSEKKGGVETLTDMRDIYENNANNGARRLREAIFSVLPVWFVEAAKTKCLATLQGGGDVPLPTRISEAIKAFDGRGISKARLERRIGKPSNDWNAFDVADLRVTFQSLQRGEIRAEDEFPPERVTAAEVIAGKQQSETSAAATAEPDAEATPPSASASTPGDGEVASRGQLNGLFAQFNKLGVSDQDERLQITEDMLGRMPLDPETEEPSWNGLTSDEASRLRKAVMTCKTRDDLESLVQMAVDQRANS